MEKILEKLKKENIRFDCRHYSGYKPCGLSEFCLDCEKFEPMGTRILVIKLAALGDVLRTTAILPGLKKQYPESHITWITDPSTRPLLENNPMIDVLYDFDASGVLTVTRLSFDLALNFEKEDRALALMDAVRASTKRGFAASESGTLSIANDAALYALQLGLHDPLKFQHNTKTYQQIIYEMAEIPYSGEEYILALSERSVKFARETRERLGISHDRFTIGLNTGCGGVFETKRWTSRGFCDLARKLDSGGNCQILLLGGRREENFNRSLLEACDASLIDTGCHNTLEEFCGIVSLCDVIVSSDSLAAHIAIALEKQAVVFFGSTCHQEVDLYGRGEKIVSDFPCSPCYLKTCDRHPSCMEDLKADRVYKAVQTCIRNLQSNRK